MSPTIAHIPRLSVWRRTQRRSAAPSGKRPGSGASSAAASGLIATRAAVLAALAEQMGLIARPR